VRLHEGMAQSFHFLVGDMGQSKYRFPWNWHRLIKLWRLRLEVANGGVVFWLWWRLCGIGSSCVSCVWRLVEQLWHKGVAAQVDCIFGGAPQEPSHDLQGESPMSGLHWLYLAMALLKALFCEFKLSRGWKPKIFDQITTTLVHCFRLEGVVFWESLMWSECCLH
jgi:hypothetical protein